MDGGQASVGNGAEEGAEPFLRRVGERVRAARQARAMSRRLLSERSGVSQRYLAQLEGGDGNISIALLARVAGALGQPVEWLVGEHDPRVSRVPRLASALRHASPDALARIEAILLGPAGGGETRARRVALIGLRGAGKSTLGRMLGARLGLPFVELNREIEALAGLSVTELMALYGEAGYRRLERQALELVAERHEGAVLAVAGGIVAEPDTFDLLCRRFHTVWLRASPEEHMARVRRQGDERPMAGNPRAMEELRSILTAREALYARADATLDTSGRDPETSARELAGVVERLGVTP